MFGLQNDSLAYLIQEAYAYTAVYISRANAAMQQANHIDQKLPGKQPTFFLAHLLKDVLQILRQGFFHNQALQVKIMQFHPVTVQEEPRLQILWKLIVCTVAHLGTIANCKEASAMLVFISCNPKPQQIQGKQIK